MQPRFSAGGGAQPVVQEQYGRQARVPGPAQTVRSYSADSSPALLKLLLAAPALHLLNVRCCSTQNVALFDLNGVAALIVSFYFSSKARQSFSNLGNLKPGSKWSQKAV